MPNQLNLVLEGFHALSEPIRLRVIEQLQAQELCVCDLCDRLQLNQSKLSFHLRILKEANLIIPRQEGRWVYYSLNPRQFQTLEAYLAQWSHLEKISTAFPCNPRSL